MLISEILTPDVIQAHNARREREREAIRMHAMEQGLEQGLEQGELRVLDRLCQHTLKRPLSEQEREGLARRLRAEGLEATTDALTACSAEELERWLEGGPSGP